MSNGSSSLVGQRFLLRAVDVGQFLRVVPGAAKVPRAYSVEVGVCTRCCFRSRTRAFDPVEVRVAVNCYNNSKVCVDG